MPASLCSDRTVPRSHFRQACTCTRWTGWMLPGSLQHESHHAICEPVLQQAGVLTMRRASTELSRERCVSGTLAWHHPSAISLERAHASQKSSVPVTRVCAQESVDMMQCRKRFASRLSNFLGTSCNSHGWKEFVRRLAVVVSSPGFQQVPCHKQR